jgi:hypothetical protein
MKERFLLSKCLDFNEMVYVYRKVFRVKEDYSKFHKLKKETEILDSEKDVI